MMAHVHKEYILKYHTIYYITTKGVFHEDLTYQHPLFCKQLNLLLSTAERRGTPVLGQG